MKAEKTITLYNDKKILSQVEKGQKYFIPDNVKVFEGTLEECKKNTLD